MADQIDNLIQQRHDTHGDFFTQANLCEVIKEMLFNHLHDNHKFIRLPIRVQNSIRYCIGHIVTRLTRAVCGDPVYHDGPLDIQGYGKLWVMAIDMMGPVPDSDAYAEKREAALREDLRQRGTLYGGLGDAVVGAALGAGLSQQGHNRRG